MVKESFDKLKTDYGALESQDKERVKCSADDKEKMQVQYKQLVDQVDFMRGKIDKVVADYDILNSNQKMHL